MQLTAEQKQFIQSHEDEDVRKVALRFSGEEMPFLLAQIAGRQTSKHKIPSWNANDEIVYPAHLSMEQASSEVTARYKALLLPKKKGLFIDLTGGLGVDFSFLSPHFSEAVYVEQSKELCDLATHNFEALKLKNTAIKNTTSEAYLKEITDADLIYLDPSRRDGAGRKVFRIEDCTPDISQLKNQLLAKSKVALIKYSPMLDISLAVNILKSVKEVHVVSLENECKELLFLLSNDAHECVYYAVNLKKNGETELFSFRIGDEQQSQPIFTSTIETYLYEPNTSILKAGAFNVVATAYSVKKLHKNSHLYTSDNLIADFPGRIFKVKQSFTSNKKNIRQFASETKKANISVRNFPLSVAEIRRQSGIEDGGNTYLFATTLADERKVWVVCEKV